jgi:hypothetical protein
MGKRRGGYASLVRKTGGTRPFGRTMRNQTTNIKMDLKDVGLDDVD